jgi:hypothetical protein
MKLLQGRTLTLIMMGGAIFAGAAQAQDPNAYIYLAHAASGRAMSSTTNPALPLDMSVNAVCVSQGLSYGDIRGPFSGPAGMYRFDFRLADSTAPCTGTPLFSATVTLAASTTYFGLVDVDASQTLTGQLFTLDTSPVPQGQTRVEVVNVTSETLRASLTLPNGQIASLDVPAGTLSENTVISGNYPTFIGLTDGTVLTGPLFTDFSQRNSYLYVLAGSPADQAVDFIGPKQIKGVF